MAEVADEVEAAKTPKAGNVCAERICEDVLVVQAILSPWKAAAYKT